MMFEPRRAGRSRGRARDHIYVTLACAQPGISWLDPKPAYAQRRDSVNTDVDYRHDENE